jgi:hypothetical protein
MFAFPAPGFFVTEARPPRVFNFAAVAASHNQPKEKILVNVFRLVQYPRSLDGWVK